MDPGALQMRRPALTGRKPLRGKQGETHEVCHRVPLDARRRMGVGSRDADVGRPAKGRLLTPHRETGVAGPGDCREDGEKGMLQR